MGMTPMANRSSGERARWLSPRFSSEIPKLAIGFSRLAWSGR